MEKRQMNRRLELVPQQFRHHRTEIYLYQELDLPPQTWVRRYDPRGNIIEESLFHSDRSLLFRWVYLYNANSMRIEGNLHAGNGTLLAKCFYDQDGNVIERRAYNSKTLPLAA